MRCNGVCLFGDKKGKKLLQRLSFGAAALPGVTVEK